MCCLQNSKATCAHTMFSSQNTVVAERMDVKGLDQDTAAEADLRITCGITGLSHQWWADFWEAPGS